MLYSKTAHTAGASSGFFDDDDKNAPADAIKVSESDHITAINLPAGWSYDFDSTKLDANGCALLVTTAPTSAFLLDKAQKDQLGILATAYQNAIVQSVSYTSKGGITKTYQADKNSRDNLMSMLAAMTPQGATPTGFYWVSADNTQVPFTLADMQGLAAAMGAQGWAAFQHLQAQKAAVAAATTVAAVQAIAW